jgi:hypothetical protein
MIRLISVGIVFAASTASASPPPRPTEGLEVRAHGFKPVTVRNEQRQSALASGLP